MTKQIEYRSDEELAMEIFNKFSGLLTTKTSDMVPFIERHIKPYVSSDKEIISIMIEVMKLVVESEVCNGCAERY